MAKPPILKGVFAAALTPLKDDLTPDDALVVAHCRWLLGRGCHGIAILGTTGEANSLCMKERIRVMEAVVEAGIDPKCLLPGTGCCALTDSVIQTTRAVELGVGGVLMLPPFYYKGVSDDGVFASYAEVIERVGSDALRIYLYHFPAMSQVPLSVALVERLVRAYPDTVVGVKDSSGDVDYLRALKSAVPNFAVFSGRDDRVQAFLQGGGAGCITGMANVASPVLRALYDGDAAAHDKASALRRAFAPHSLIPALKALMAQATGYQGWATVRPPLTVLTDEAVAILMADLAASGLTLDDLEGAPC